MRDNARHTGTAVLARNYGQQDTDDDRFESDLAAFSAKYYELRQNMWARMNRGDVWIAIAIYLMLAGFAFAIF